MNKVKGIHLLKWCISPTLYFSECYKKGATTPDERGKRVKRLNKGYAILAGFMFVSIYLMKSNENLGFMIDFIVYGYPLWSFSRANEIFMAFIKDVFDKLNPAKRNKNGLQYYERIALALTSFFELIIHYAMLYFLIDTYYLSYGLMSNLFNEPLKDLLTALYFSVITIVSIGYGDYYPIHPFGKILVMYEIISGLLLLAVSFTVYVGLDLDEKEAS